MRQSVPVPPTTLASTALPRKSGLPTYVTIMIGSVGVSAGSEQLASALFAPAQLPDVLEIISWYDDVQADEVHHAVLTLSKGDVEALLDLVVAAVDDVRNVLMWASLPEPTPVERAAARVRAEELVRGAQQHGTDIW